MTDREDFEKSFDMGPSLHLLTNIYLASSIVPPTEVIPNRCWELTPGCVCIHENPLTTEYVVSFLSGMHFLVGTDNQMRVLLSESYTKFEHALLARNIIATGHAEDISTPAGITDDNYEEKLEWLVEFYRKKEYKYLSDLVDTCLAFVHRDFIVCLFSSEDADGTLTYGVDYTYEGKYTRYEETYKRKAQAIVKFREVLLEVRNELRLKHHNGKFPTLLG